MNRFKKSFYAVIIVFVAACIGNPQYAYMETPKSDIIIVDEKLEDGLKSILKLSAEQSITEENLQSLTVVDLSSKGITNLSGLEYAVNITHLNLANNQIRDITPLKQLTKIRGLNVSGNEITSINDLEKLTDMGSLQVNNNQLKSIEVIRHFPRLHTLEASNNQITKIDVSGNTNLTVLNVADNLITDIKSLSKLKALINLDVSNNEVISLEALGSLSNLTLLNISRNNIEDISPISKLIKMTFLVAANNKISDLSPLQKLTQLVSIDLTSNRVYNLESLSNLTKLNYLYLSDNRVWDLKPIENLHFDFHYDTGAPRYGLYLNNNYLDASAGTKTLKIVEKLNPEYISPQKVTQRLIIGSSTAYVGEKSVKLNTIPFISKQRTYVPIRFVSTQLGATVNWNQKDKQVTIQKDGKTIKWTVDSKKVLVDGKAINYDVPMLLKSGYTFVPIRFISEQLNSSVVFDNNKKMVIIFDEKNTIL